MHSLGRRANLVQVREGAPALMAECQHRSRASAQAGFISQLCPGQHWRLRRVLPPCSSLQISFVKKSCRCNTGWRLHFHLARVAQRRGTTSRASPVQVRFLPRAPFRPASFKVKQRSFKPLNSERYRGGPPFGSCRDAPPPAGDVLGDIALRRGCPAKGGSASGAGTTTRIRPCESIGSVRPAPAGAAARRHPSPASRGPEPAPPRSGRGLRR